MKRVLITGARGSLGQALQEVIRKEKAYASQYEMIVTASREDEEGRYLKLDISNEEEVKKMVQEYHPEIIVNCAAYTAVDLCEDEVEKAKKANADGPKYLAMAAKEAGALLIHVSTDYVFDGQGVRPYTEEDVPAPVSVYGKTKLEGEKNIIASTDKYFILRTAWLYGEGKSFVTTMLRLAESGNTVRVVDDQLGCPTSALELARAICYLFERSEYGIYHTVCEGTATWYEFAKQIFLDAGKEVELLPITTGEFKTKAVRPAYSVLDLSKWNHNFDHRFGKWQDALLEVLRKRD